MPINAKRSEFHTQWPLTGRKDKTNSDWFNFCRQFDTVRECHWSQKASCRLFQALVSHCTSHGVTESCHFSVGLVCSLFLFSFFVGLGFFNLVFCLFLMRSKESMVAGFRLLSQWENKHVSRCSFQSEQQAELTCSMAAESLLGGEKVRISNCGVVIQYGHTISVTACDQTELDKL